MKNIRMAPRKVRLVANMIKGLSASRAIAQLTFFTRKPAPLILKLIKSAVANAKHNFEIEENNLFVKSIVVEGGATLKRWLPRAMGRASAIRKRTCSVKLILEEVTPGAAKKKTSPKVEVLKEDQVLPEAREKAKKVEPAAKEAKPKTPAPERSHGASGDSKYKNFSRQTFGNIKKVFRRKSI